MLAIGFILVFELLTDTRNASLDRKKLHLLSEIELFDTNWLRTLFVGFGPGTKFYTAGFNDFVALCELSYMELFRNYGIFPGIGILFIFAYPIILLFNNKNYSLFYKFSFFIGFLSYMFIAGTNPFLNSMTGFTVLAVFYYMAQNNVFEEVL